MLARNGTMMQVDTDWVKARVPVKELKSLAVVEPEATLRLPPIDELVFAKAVAFFHRVYKEHGTESAVLLHYSESLGWELTVPNQKVSRAAVHYEMEERIPGYRCVGTMHSHGSMGASHSSVDTRDEADFDGVHITIGALNKYPTFEMDAELTVRSHRFALDHSHIGGVSEVEESPLQEVPNYLRKSWWSKRRLFRTDPTELDNWQLPEEWLQRVKLISMLFERAPISDGTTGEAVRTPTVYDPNTWQGRGHYIPTYRVPQSRHKPDSLDRTIEVIYAFFGRYFKSGGKP